MSYFETDYKTPITAFTNPPNLSAIHESYLIGIAQSRYNQSLRLAKE